MLDLVITSRLGVRFADRPLLSTAEVEQRIELLRRTSARSLLALAPLRPLWVIQTDPAHLETVQTGLQETPSLRAIRRRIHVVTREDGEPSSAQLATIAFPPRFLCLRLDADDYYLPDPLRRALARFADQPAGSLIDFPRGYLVDLEATRARRLTYSVQGPFYGVVTTPDDPIAAIGHHGRARVGRQCHEQLDRAWVQTVHHDNIFTQYRRHSTVRELRSMLKQMRRARGTRALAQILIRPYDLAPLRTATQRRLHDLVASRDALSY